MGRKWDDLITEEPSRSHRETITDLARVELERNVDLAWEKPHEERRGWLFGLLGAATMAGITALVSRQVVHSLSGSSGQSMVLDDGHEVGEFDAALLPSSLHSVDDVALLEELDLLDELETMGAYDGGQWTDQELELPDSENV